MPKNLTIIIGGDTVPTISNEDFLINGQDEMVFNGVKSVFTSADLTVVNLECPLTNENYEIKKAGPCLKANPNAINGLVDAGIQIFSLANNHIMDFGPEGLRDTLKGIQRKQALSVGAGNNLQEARKILFIEKNDYKIAILSVAEHEFSIAEEDIPGANPFDVFDTMEDIRTASNSADFVIVIYHGGIEHYRLPSPNLQKICRKMVENGATYVICQHSHCIGAYEKYCNGHIVYGQGNLLFDYNDNEMWKSGVLIKITIEDSIRQIKFIPIVKKRNRVELADDGEKENILSSFEERSTFVYDKQIIQSEFQEFSKQRYCHYLQAFLGFGKVLKRVDNRIHNTLSQVISNRISFMSLYNYINCESQLEVMRNGLEFQYKKNVEKTGIK